MSGNMEEIEELDGKEKKPGVLSVIDLSTEEREVFLDYLESSNPQMNASYIFALLGDEQFLKFFDVMAGSSIKVPTRESIVKVINYVKIYSFCKSKDFSKESYERAAKIFDRRLMSVQRIVDKVRRVLDKPKE